MVGHGGGGWRVGMWLWVAGVSGGAGEARGGGWGRLGKGRRERGVWRGMG